MGCLQGSQNRGKIVVFGGKRFTEPENILFSFSSMNPSASDLSIRDFNSITGCAPERPDAPPTNKISSILEINGYFLNSIPLEHRFQILCSYCLPKMD